jgi:hypothetical protein
MLALSIKIHKLDSTISREIVGKNRVVTARKTQSNKTITTWGLSSEAVQPFSFVMVSNKRGVEDQRIDSEITCQVYRSYPSRFKIVISYATIIARGTGLPTIANNGTVPIYADLIVFLVSTKVNKIWQNTRTQPPLVYRI